MTFRDYGQKVLREPLRQDGAGADSFHDSVHTSDSN